MRSILQQAKPGNNIWYVIGTLNYLILVPRTEVLDAQFSSQIRTFAWTSAFPSVSWEAGGRGTEWAGGTLLRQRAHFVHCVPGMGLSKVNPNPNLPQDENRTRIRIRTKLPNVRIRIRILTQFLTTTKTTRKTTSRTSTKLLQFGLTAQFYVIILVIKYSDF